MDVCMWENGCQSVTHLIYIINIHWPNLLSHFKWGGVALLDQRHEVSEWECSVGSFWCDQQNATLTEAHKTLR